MLCVHSTRFSRWVSGIDTVSRLRWSSNVIVNGGVVYCGQISSVLSDCEPMDGGVGLRVMWRNGENRGRINPLQYGGFMILSQRGMGGKNDDYRGIGMSLKIHLKNLGILKQAEFSLGDLTLICGENNTGKTYAAYALYGFLLSWRGLLDFGVSEDQAQRLLTDGGIKIGLVGYVERAAQMFAEACERYIDQLDTIFVPADDRFRNSEFHIEIGAINIRDKEFTHEMEIGPERFLAIQRKRVVKSSE